MKKNELEEGTNPNLDSGEIKVDHIDHKSTHMTEESNHMEAVINKTARLAKLNLLLTILGLGGLGYLHFSDKAATEDAIARSKATMKQEIVGEVKDGMASTQQLQGLVEKNAELEVKIDSYAGQISNLEMKNEQLQAEIQKTANLRTKMAEIQASMKKAKAAPAKQVAKNSKNSKSPASKTTKKPLKKGRK